MADASSWRGAPCFNAHSQLAVRKTPEELAHLLRMLCDAAVRAVNNSARRESDSLRNGKYVNEYITPRTVLSRDCAAAYTDTVYPAVK